MGFDLTRFQGEVDQELICPICSGVLEDPVQAPECEHTFCRTCITEWIKRQAICPLDRTPIASEQLRAAPRILRNLLARLCISCDNIMEGCQVIIKFDSLLSHLEHCEYKPERPMLCEQGCSLVIPRNELKDHNCVKELRNIIHTQEQKLEDMKREMSEQQLQITENRRELHLIKDSLRALKFPDPVIKNTYNYVESVEIERWSASLPRAKVTRWGGMISTPDRTLQAMIKVILRQYNCPRHIIDELTENCHEKNWPCGLSSLETRQNSRRLYDTYVCKRVPGKQIVIALYCDNKHMPQFMMTPPGLVMIFAHGIE
ncbi:E3 ubiquitin-protein ligase NRDP1 elgi isoform X2 [Nomia melanderi]|uniref:E3 ubiquitin-protein ligase NRDP1 elgi isoform X2 n=1 Tax=Nomia melanderi TaxID=2448451 RepID=UPI0013043D3F|nr:E3 ubiquitin-protein ligase NRDP1 isoform X2 [Nomia melanderi]XP_031828418.1 E3 ubiquitin-protein ligase NRDP1 isoform X2 [Nomia melanderi]